MLLLRAPSLDATHRIAAILADRCRGGDTIVLSGELGVGKTAFAQGFGTALGVEQPMTSPTYTLVNSYDLPRRGGGAAPRSLHHADLYRLTRTTEVLDLGLDELAEFDGVVLIEWGDVLDGAFGDHLVVHLELDRSGESRSGDNDWADGARVLEISALGGSWASRWGELLAALEEFSC